MKDKTLKNIRLCCYIALVFCLVWVISNIINFTLGMVGVKASSHSINWSENTAMKVIVLACYFFGTVALIALCVKAVFNVLKGIRDNTVFPRSNEKLMFWIALADFIYLFGYCNLQILWDNEAVLALTDNIFITPFFLLFFAFMYKVAADAVDENNLTI